MSDIESDTENNTPSSTAKTPSASPCNSLNVNKQCYQPKQIENLLKISTDPKQYIIVNNESTLLKSGVWKNFGFPAKSQSDDKHEIISGFVSCFNCFKTLLFDGSTKYMIKHRCLIPASARPEQVVHQELMDKYLPKKPVIQKQDKEKMKEKFVIWCCSSIRPFSIIEDTGFIDIVNESIRIGM